MGIIGKKEDKKEITRTIKTYIITFKVADKFRDELIEALIKSEEALKEAIHGVKVHGKAIITEDKLSFEIIYPVPVPDSMFKYVAFRQLKKKLKDIDKNGKADFEIIKTKEKL